MLRNDNPYMEFLCFLSRQATLTPLFSFIVAQPLSSQHSIGCLSHSIYHCSCVPSYGRLLNNCPLYELWLRGTYVNPRLSEASSVFPLCQNNTKVLVEVERFELPISGSQNQRRRPNWATPRYVEAVIFYGGDRYRILSRLFYAKFNCLITGQSKRTLQSRVSRPTFIFRRSSVALSWVELPPQ